MQITVTISGSKQLRNKLGRIATGMHNLSGAFNEIGEELSKYYMTQGFLSQGGVFGEDWNPLSRSYALRKAKKWPGRPPLVASGKMISGFRYDASATGVVIGNRMPYFKYHQSTLDRKKIPRRATMGVNDPVKAMIHAAIVNDITNTIRRA
jgi:phage gpG-like protein